MKMIFSGEMDMIRGGGPADPAIAVSGVHHGGITTNSTSQPIDTGGVETGGGWVVEQSSLDALQYQVDHGTDASITSAAQSLYTGAQSSGWAQGSGAYNDNIPGGGSVGSPPPNFWDIYNSIPGTPPNKVYKIKHSFKIC
jgi:hypothetical protein